jgi:hypothetical protein
LFPDGGNSVLGVGNFTGMSPKCIKRSELCFIGRPVYFFPDTRIQFCGAVIIFEVNLAATQFFKAKYLRVRGYFSSDFFFMIEW